MARNRNSRSRRGGRGSRGLLVREVAYATPIIEPSNFLEFDIRNTVSPAGTANVANITWGDIMSGAIITMSGGQLSTPAQFIASMAKFRLSSMVIDPLTVVLADGQNIMAANATPYELIMGISGNHYSQSDLQKPLKVRFGKDFGDDGMWFAGTKAIVSPTIAAVTPASGDTFCHLDMEYALTSQDSITYDIHFRMAWTD